MSEDLGIPELTETLVNEAENAGEAASAQEQPKKSAESSSKSTKQAEGSDSSEESAKEQPAYTPNYKLKVMDQEKEIPEKFRELIKDAETEKEVREIFEKAYGLEFAKPKHEAREHQFNTLQAEHNQVIGSINEIKHLYQKGDMDGFFEKLAIPPQKVLQYALEKLKYEELPPEQKAMIDAQKNAEKERYRVERESQTNTSYLQNQVAQARRMVLDSELARPDVKSMVDTFDSRMGKPGAFVQEVIRRGKLTWIESGYKVDLTPRQAIDEVVKLFGLEDGGQASSNPTQAGAPASAAKPKTATIPNVGAGRPSAPLKSKPKSIEDLKKLRDSMT